MRTKIDPESYALITGGSSGMGLEYARALASKGCKLLLVSNETEKLQKVGAELSQTFGVSVLTHYQDLAKEDAADSLYSYCKESGITVDILINNAGMFFFKELSTAERARVDTILMLHVQTPTRLCMLFSEDMKRRGRGFILNVSSMGAELPFAGISTYSASKAYIKNFSKGLYYECRPYGVGVSVVCPAAVATPLYGLKPSLLKFGTDIQVIQKPKTIVRRALRGMFRCHRVILPGAMNYYLPPLFAIMPKCLMLRAWKALKPLTK